MSNDGIVLLQLAGIVLCLVGVCVLWWLWRNR